MGFPSASFLGFGTRVMLLLWPVQKAVATVIRSSRVMPVSPESSFPPMTYKFGPILTTLGNSEAQLVKASNTVKDASDFRDKLSMAFTVIF